MEIKIEQFLLDEEKRDIRQWVHELHKKKDLSIGDFIESGSLGVKVYEICDSGIVAYSVYRTIALVNCKRKKPMNHKLNEGK